MLWGGLFLREDRLRAPIPLLRELRRVISANQRGTFRAAHHRFLSLTYDNIGRSNREDENTVLKELVPIEACLNSSKAGLSGF